MAKNIKVNTAKMKKDSKKLKELSLDMAQQINRMYTELGAIRKNWSDSACTEYLKAFNLQLETIETFNKVMCKVCTTLDLGVEMYDSMINECSSIPNISL